MGPADHGLHMIQSRDFDHHPAYTRLVNLIFLATTMSSSLHRLIVAINSFPSYRLGHQSVLALSGAEVLRVACEPKQFAPIIGSRRLLADQRLFNLVVVEQEGFSHVLQRKATENSHE